MSTTQPGRIIGYEIAGKIYDPADVMIVRKTDERDEAGDSMNRVTYYNAFTEARAALDAAELLGLTFQLRNVRQPGPQGYDPGYELIVSGDELPLSVIDDLYYGAAGADSHVRTGASAPGWPGANTAASHPSPACDSGEE
jgi:hypothetical protein